MSGIWQVTGLKASLLKVLETIYHLFLADEWNWDKWTGQDGAEAEADTWLEQEGDYQPHCEDSDFVVCLLCIANRCPRLPFGKQGVSLIILLVL